MNIFALAARMKLRFPFKGQATLEDMWDLTREQLSELHQALTAAEAATTGMSLIQRRATSFDPALLRIAIIKHIFEVKSEEMTAARNAGEARRRKQRILEVIADKQDGALNDLSIDELNAMADKL
jgi:hypothetical protein